LTYPWISGRAPSSCPGALIW